MFLKQNGKQVIIETKDGESKEVNVSDIYGAKKTESKFENRIDFNYGANKYNFIRGNSIIYDSWVLTNVMENKFINTRNVNYDFDLTKEFTWDFRELVEIKKKKRVVEIVHKPTLKILQRIDSSKKFDRAKSLGKIVSK